MQFLGKGLSALILMFTFVAGIIFWGGFNLAMESTNTEEFCISCHEMEQNVYQEYQKSIHYSNRTGVRATCPDCHVPKEWTHKVMRKLRATNELYHWILGSIDTREKFQNKRFELANHVWDNMKQTDSRECRNCHNKTHMDLELQSTLSKGSHELAKKLDMTCIECHQGITHTLPSEFDKEIIIDKFHEKIEQEKLECYQCHENLIPTSSEIEW